MSFSEHEIFLAILSLILPLILILLNLTLFKKHMVSRNKPSAFECGFDPKLSARIPFSLKFYLIAIIFLIFDIEIALILPIPLISHFNPSISMSFLVSIFIWILFLGLTLEWKEGALKWLN